MCKQSVSILWNKWGTVEASADQGGVHSFRPATWWRGSWRRNDPLSNGCLCGMCPSAVVTDQLTDRLDHKGLLDRPRQSINWLRNRENQWSIALIDYIIDHKAGNYSNLDRLIDRIIDRLFNESIKIIQPSSEIRYLLSCVSTGGLFTLGLSGSENKQKNVQTWSNWEEYWRKAGHDGWHSASWMSKGETLLTFCPQRDDRRVCLSEQVEPEKHVLWLSWLPGVLVVAD